MSRVARWRGIVNVAHSALRTQTRHVSSLTKYNPQNRLPAKLPLHQSVRTAYNPFDSHHGDHDESHDEDEDDTKSRKEKRTEKRRRLQQSTHSTHSRYDEMDDEGDSGNILLRDVRIVGWSPEKIYEIVMNVGEYDKFIPYCTKSTVFSSKTAPRHDFMEAELQVGFSFYELGYTSKVHGSTSLDGKKIVEAVCENAAIFDHLTMAWVIAPGPVEDTSSMHFDVSFKFSNRLLQKIAGQFKTMVLEQMIPAFEERLRVVHGEPTILSSLAASAGKVNKRKRRR